MTILQAAELVQSSAVAYRQPGFCSHTVHSGASI